MTETALSPITLVLGGARSGKSRFAEELIESAARPALHLATVVPRDEEMHTSIAARRARRGAHWTTTEEKLELVNILLTETTRPVLIDCLTVWIANLVAAKRDLGFEIARLLSVLPQARVPVVLVANEIGLGLAPDNPLARALCDHAGRLNQDVARMAQRVVFIAAGLPLMLKG